MGGTDVEMTGETSAGEDPYGELVAEAIGFARSIARRCSHNTRKRPLCAGCQEREAVPRIRKKRVNKGPQKQSESASFQKCITAKQTQLAFDKLKKELAEFAIKELTDAMTEDDRARKTSVEKSIRNLVPAIKQIEANRKIRNAKREQRARQEPEQPKESLEQDEESEIPNLIDDIEHETDDNPNITMDDFGVEDGPLSSFVETKVEMSDKLKTPPSEPVSSTIKAKLPLRKRTRPPTQK